MIQPEILFAGKLIFASILIAIAIAISHYQDHQPRRRRPWQ